MASPGNASFYELLDEGGLEFTPPPAMQHLEIQAANDVFPYEYAMRAADDGIEVRFAIRPIARLDVHYDDPHGSAPHPNDLFKMLFDQATLQLAGTTESVVSAYPPAVVESRFNAQWAAASMFDADSRFSDRFRYGLLIALHRDDLADAYVICLFNSYDVLRARIGEIESSLRFADSAGAG